MWRIAVLGLLACAACDTRLATARADDAARRPNIVLLLADDLGYGELGCQGNRQIPTPAIDSIAARGARMTSGYVTASYCSASRAGLLTGRYQTRFGYEFNPIGAHNDDPRVGLPASQRTLAQRLHDLGYATALVGKWHLGGAAPYHPLRRGFDEFFGFLHEGHFYLPPPYRAATTMLRRRALPDGGRGRWISPDGRLILSTHMGHDEPPYDANNPILRGGGPIEETAYLTDALTREAVDFIERHQHRPFFLYLAYNAVHSPLQADDAHMRRFSHIDDPHRRVFAAMLAHLDDSVASVLAKLDALELMENTLIVFLSDNGGPTRELTSSNLPLRGGKGDLHEGGIRVPFLVRWDGRVPAGLEHHQPVSSLDLFPTALAAAGVEAESIGPTDGLDLLPRLAGAESGAPREPLFWRMNNKAALRWGDWKLVRDGRRGGQWELYDLSNDLAEARNLSESRPDQARRMEARWRQLNEEMSEPFWRPGS